MEKIYDNFERDYLTLEQAREILFEIARTTKDANWNDFAKLDIDDVCEQLDNEDLFVCGQRYLVVDVED